MKKYDVVIIGGGTAGCSCAYNCAKLGLKTAVIESSGCLGGTMTRGLVVPVMETGKNRINTDFYEKLTGEMRKVGAQITYQNNPGWFNPEILKIVLDKILKEVGVDLFFYVSEFDVTFERKIIESVQLYTNNSNKILSTCNESTYADNTITNSNKLSVCICSRYYVDATGNLDFSKKINCNFLENKMEHQPVSLRFIMGNVDLKKFSKWLLTVDNDRSVTSVEDIDGTIHLSTAYTWDTDKHWALASFFEKAVKDNILKDTDRNYFQIFTVAGMPNSVAFNCPRYTKPIDTANNMELSEAVISCREAILRLAEFCKKIFPGFENACISNISDMIGVRSSRRIKGKYIYTISDLRSGKKFNNPALISNYPVDVHNSSKNSSTLEFNGEYQLPLDSLMSYDYDNLFVVGRGISADELSQGALRVQANCFAMGEAVAKHIKSIISNYD